VAHLACKEVTTNEKKTCNCYSTTRWK
jgi:hypothetical protein